MTKSTMTSKARADRPRGTKHDGRTRTLWVLVTAGVVIALIGAGLAAVLLARTGQEDGGAGPAGVGDAVRTSFGTFTVTKTNTTFVPDSQGPPSPAQHSGASGNDQLQVWVRLANDKADQPAAYSPSQFRLVGDPGSTPRPPDGSTLEAATLPKGASVDGQVWFDMTKVQRPSGHQWLEYTAPDGQRIRVALGEAPTPAPAPTTSTPAHEDSGHDEPGHDDSNK